MDALSAKRTVESYRTPGVSWSSGQEAMDNKSTFTTQEISRSDLCCSSVKCSMIERLFQNGRNTDFLTTFACMQRVHCKSEYNFALRMACIQTENVRNSRLGFINDARLAKNKASDGYHLAWAKWLEFWSSVSNFSRSDWCEILQGSSVCLLQVDVLQADSCSREDFVQKLTDKRLSRAVQFVHIPFFCWGTASHACSLVKDVFRSMSIVYIPRAWRMALCQGNIWQRLSSPKSWSLQNTGWGKELVSQSLRMADLAADRLRALSDLFVTHLQIAADRRQVHISRDFDATVPCKLIVTLNPEIPMAIIQWYAV